MKTENIIKTAKARFAHNQNKQILKEKYEAKMLFASHGGMWKASAELLTTLQFCSDEAVIIDQYDTPVKINTKELHDKAILHWQEQMNAWLVEFNESSTQR
jgi:hypothetical protein